MRYHDLESGKIYVNKQGLKRRIVAFETLGRSPQRYSRAADLPNEFMNVIYEVPGREHLGQKKCWGATFASWATSEFVPPENHMKVSDLIARLQELPQDAQVYVGIGGTAQNCIFAPIHEITTGSDKKQVYIHYDRTAIL